MSLLFIGIERTTSGVRLYLAQNDAGEIGLLVQVAHHQALAGGTSIS
jgi:hypothetical protein